jgi:hypothetical protein
LIGENGLNPFNSINPETKWQVKVYSQIQPGDSKISYSVDDAVPECPSTVDVGNIGLSPSSFVGYFPSELPVWQPGQHLTR